jgi:hypothetical protein
MRGKPNRYRETHWVDYRVIIGLFVAGYLFFTSLTYLLTCL